MPNPQPPQPVGQGNYTVKQGDCIESIAHAHGHFWETIWDDPANAELKRAREDPNVLMPGDRVEIMPKRPKEVSKEPEQTHRFRRKGVPSQFRIRLLDDEGEPRAGVPYMMSIDGKTHDGSADSDGQIIEWIPPGARAGRLVVDGDEERALDLDFRHIDPIGTPAGIQKRLSNLGFYAGPFTEELDEATRAALALFQGSVGLEPTGSPDEHTLSTLAQSHGS